MEPGGVVTGERDKYKMSARRILDDSQYEARRLNSQEVGTEHILLALIKETDCVAVKLMASENVNIQKVYTDIRFLLLWMKHMVHILFLINIFLTAQQNRGLIW